MVIKLIPDANKKIIIINIFYAHERQQSELNSQWPHSRFPQNK
jgi:hypothetical protein